MKQTHFDTHPQIIDRISVLDHIDMQRAAAQSSGATDPLSERSIGEIIRDNKQLNPRQVDQIVELQRERKMKFGEAAVALGFARDEDVVWALSQQFHYPYAPEAVEQLNSELVVASQPFGKSAEAFRALRSQLMMRLFSGRDPRRRALSVVSPDSGDGKTYFAANIAVAFSQLGGRTLLIDADMRSPRLHEVFSVENGAGLSGILGGRSEANVIRQVAHLPSLFILPVGVTPPNPLELAERPAFSLLLRELLGKFDHVVVDTPAAQHGADAGVIAVKCGAAVVIARQGRSSLNSLNDFVHLLRESPVTLAGVVMNEF
jgi:protein-tyrosine kinase